MAPLDDSLNMDESWIFYAALAALFVGGWLAFKIIKKITMALIIVLLIIIGLIITMKFIPW